MGISMGPKSSVMMMLRLKPKLCLQGFNFPLMIFLNIEPCKDTALNYIFSSPIPCDDPISLAPGSRKVIVNCDSDPQESSTQLEHAPSHFLTWAICGAPQGVLRWR